MSETTISQIRNNYCRLTNRTSMVSGITNQTFLYNSNDHPTVTCSTATATRSPATWKREHLKTYPLLLAAGDAAAVRYHYHLEYYF